MVGEIIVVGMSPTTANLGGDALAEELPEGSPLSFSGLYSWRISPNSTGTITFETDAAEVQLWVTTHPLASGSSSGRTRVRAFDAFDVLIGFASITRGTGWHLVSFSGSIARIDVSNDDDFRMNGIDDFAFTALPEPSATLMLLSGGALLAILGRRCYAP